ncbi:hybrid sensor histidine kinase/response regulator [filamentous cyanobacterium CCP2]|nr:hybrid sensor histidine kinase/response regulator [filamentous cyanobacterium CCP2]
MNPSLEENTLKTGIAKILIVEDERAIARDLKESLEHLGYYVPAIASSSTEAVALVETWQPDLILMDIVLEDSDCDGIETAQEIRDLFRVPVVYLTAHATSAILERAKATDPFGYLLKPFREKDLWVAIETALKRHRLERALHEREEWLTHILNGMGDGVIVFNTEARIRFINPVAEALTGWTESEAMDQPIQSVFQVIDEKERSPLLSTLLQTVIHGEPFYLSLDTLLITKSGQEVPIFDSAAPLRDQQGVVTGGIIVFRDAHALRLANERDLAVAHAQQLELQMQEMENLSRLKDDFLSTVSHELRTPLSNIKMATRMLTIVLDQLDLLAQSTGLTATPISRYIHILQQETEQELRLINDLLDIQRIQAETYSLELSLIQLSNWIPELVEPFRPRIAESNQTLYLNIPSDLPDLWSDPHALTRILSELLNNACKYTPPEEPITVTATVQLRHGAVPYPWMILEVCNSGITIPLEEQERIFDPFYRIPQSDRWKRGGTGLGLSLVKKFTSLLGGQIEVSSTSNSVCFRILLPMKEFEATPG